MRVSLEDDAAQQKTRTAHFVLLVYQPETPVADVPWHVGGRDHVVKLAGCRLHH